MHLLYKAPVLALLAAIAIVVALAAVHVLRALFRQPSRRPWVLWLGRGAVVACLVGVVCMVDAFAWEPYHLTVSHVRIKTDKLEPGTAPIRLAHFSDLHSDPEPRVEDQLIQAIQDAKPDLIAFTGDSINGMAGLPVQNKCLSAIAKIAPFYAVKGNWDAWNHQQIQVFKGTGARELTGQPQRLMVRGTPIVLVGAPFGDTWALARAFNSIPRRELSVFMYHLPDEIYETARLGADVYLAGHTHGGQVRLPFYGALLTFSRWGKRFEAGLYHVPPTWLYVNRGVGMEGGSAPRLRFLCPPELTLIELTPP